MEKDKEITQLSAEKNGIQANVQKVAEEVQSLETRIAQTEEEAGKIQTGYEQAQADVERLKDEFLDFMRDLAENRNFQRNFHSQERALLAQIDTVQNDLGKIKKEIAQCVSELEHNHLAQDEERESIIGRKEKIKETRRTQSKYNEELAALQGKIRERTERHTQIQSRLKTLQELDEEYEGYSYSVRRLMQNTKMKELTLGTIAEVITVPKGLETAFEVALGSALQNVITPSEKEAETLIEWLKAVRGGRATFLPLGAMEPVGFPKHVQPLLEGEGILGTGVELLEFDKRYEPAIGSLLGRTVITEDLQTALALKKKLKQFNRIVTRDGSVVFPSGAMTGGSLNNRTSGLLTRKGEIDDLENQVTLLVIEIQELQEAEMNLNGTIKALTGQLDSLNHQEVQSQMRLQGLGQKEAQIKEEMERLENNATALLINCKNSRKFWPLYE